MKRKLWRLIVVGAILCSIGAVSAAEEFYVVGSGGKPLGKPIASLPATITDSGMYYVTHNLTSSSTGILVDADNVTLDLMGFTLTGPGKTGNTYRGVQVSSGRSGVEVRNGCITNFGGDGVACFGTNCRFLGLRVLNVGAAGISVSFKNQVTSCFASACGHEGIYTEGHSIIKGNTVTGNTVDGIRADQYSLITGNLAYDNGSRGIYAGEGSTIQANQAHGNGSGIESGAICTVTDNTVQSTSGAALATGNSCTISRNTARYGELWQFPWAITTGTYCLLTTNNAWGGVTIGAESIQVDNNFH